MTYEYYPAGNAAAGKLWKVHVQLDPLNEIPDVPGTPTEYETIYSYDVASGLVSQVDQSDGTSMSFGYVQVGNTWKIETFTDGLGKETSFSYVGDYTRITDPLHQSTILVHDAQGRLTEVRSGVPEGTDEGIATQQGLQLQRYVYDGDDNVQEIRDADGHALVTFNYQADTGNLLTQTDGVGNSIVRTYNEAHQLLTETAHADGRSLTTRYVYDATHPALLRFVIRAEGRVTEYRYNAQGLRSQAWTYAGAAYDLARSARRRSLPRALFEIWAGLQDLTRAERTEYGYDFRGQLQTVTTWESLSAVGAGVGDASITRFVYNQRGELLHTYTPDQRSETQMFYDGLGRAWKTSWTTGDVNGPRLSATTVFDDQNRRTILTQERSTSRDALCMSTSSCWRAPWRWGSPPLFVGSPFRRVFVPKWRMGGLISS